MTVFTRCRSINSNARLSNAMNTLRCDIVFTCACYRNGNVGNCSRTQARIDDQVIIQFGMDYSWLFQWYAYSPFLMLEITVPLQSAISLLATLRTL